MIKYRIEETINRPVNEVFPYLADPMLHPKWSPVSDVHVTPPGEMQVGTTVNEMMKVGLKMAPFRWEVTEYSPGTSGLKGWQRLLEPFVGREIQRDEAAELSHFKKLLEQPA